MSVRFGGGFPRGGEPPLAFLEFSKEDMACRLKADNLADFVIQSRRLCHTISPISSYNFADFVAVKAASGLASDDLCYFLNALHRLEILNNELHFSAVMHSDFYRSVEDSLVCTDGNFMYVHIHLF